MRLKQITTETASCGSTTAAAMGTTLAGGTPPAGQFFGGDPSSSIYPQIKKQREARKKKKVSEKIIPMPVKFQKSKENMSETKTQAKTPEKPSGKAQLVGSTKPYREPHVLGPTEPIAKDKILGGTEKKNKTLSTKSFGTCSANNDPGNKSILGEFTSTESLGINLQKELMRQMWFALQNMKSTKIKQSDVLRAASDVARENFGMKDVQHMTEIINSLFMNRKDGLAKGQKPHNNIQESLTYKEFRNASSAENKVCPVCNKNFKNVHSKNQLFCSLACEGKGVTVEKLKETFNRDTYPKEYHEGYRNGMLDYRNGHRSEIAWSGDAPPNNNDFRRWYSKGYRDGWMEARMDADNSQRTDNTLSGYYADTADSVVQDQPWYK